jgi:hypothetical protein
MMMLDRLVLAYVATLGAIMVVAAIVAKVL